MTWRETVFLLLASMGVFTLLVSSYGMVRLHGVHQRMQAASVGSTVGIALLLVSAGVYFVNTDELARMIVLIVFFFATSPIATTAIARAAYRRPLDLSTDDFSHDDMANPAYAQDSLSPAPLQAGDPETPHMPAPTLIASSSANPTSDAQVS